MAYKIVKTNSYQRDLDMDGVHSDNDEDADSPPGSSRRAALIKLIRCEH